MVSNSPWIDDRLVGLPTGQWLINPYESVSG